MQATEAQLGRASRQPKDGRSVSQLQLYRPEAGRRQVSCAVCCSSKVSQPAASEGHLPLCRHGIHSQTLIRPDVPCISAKSTPRAGMCNCCKIKRQGCMHKAGIQPAISSKPAARPTSICPCHLNYHRNWHVLLLLSHLSHASHLPHLLHHSAGCCSCQGRTM